MKNGITKEMLDDLYIKKNISTHKIARMLGCSSETIANRCREFGIVLKGQGKRKKKIDKEILVRLYVREGKTLTEITEILGCSYSRIRNYCLEYGIHIRNENNKREDYSEKRNSGNEKIQ
jgi:transposase